PAAFSAAPRAGGRSLGAAAPGPTGGAPMPVQGPPAGPAPGRRAARPPVRGRVFRGRGGWGGRGRGPDRAPGGGQAGGRVRLDRGTPLCRADRGGIGGPGGARRGSRRAGPARPGGGTRRGVPARRRVLGG